MKVRGYVEGQNILLERRYTAGRPHRIDDIAAELVRLSVDLNRRLVSISHASSEECHARRNTERTGCHATHPAICPKGMTPKPQRLSVHLPT